MNTEALEGTLEGTSVYLNPGVLGDSAGLAIPGGSTRGRASPVSPGPAGAGCDGHL